MYPAAWAVDTDVPTVALRQPSSAEKVIKAVATSIGAAVRTKPPVRCRPLSTKTIMFGTTILGLRGAQIDAARNESRNGLFESKPDAKGSNALDASASVTSSQKYGTNERNKMGKCRKLKPVIFIVRPPRASAIKRANVRIVDAGETLPEYVVEVFKTEL